MQKLIALLSQQSSSLEDQLIDGEKRLEMYVENRFDAEEILSKLEPEVREIRKNTEATLAVKVLTESGQTILRGQIKDEFMGIFSA